MKEFIYKLIEQKKFDQLFKIDYDKLIQFGPSFIHIWHKSHARKYSK